MRFWLADYDWRGSYGAYEEKRYAVVAETKEVALSLVMEAEPKTTATLWSITEIITEKAKAYYISSFCP